MDFRAVVIFLCLLSAQAACGPVRNEKRAMNATIRMIQNETRTALDRLSSLLVAPEQLPNISCLSLNMTELVGTEQQPLATHYLPTFRCYMLNMSNLTPEVSPQLRTISQYTQDMERLISGHVAPRDCALPVLEDMQKYVYVKCLLQLLDQRLSKPTF